MYNVSISQQDGPWLWEGLKFNVAPVVGDHIAGLPDIPNNPDAVFEVVERTIYPRAAEDTAYDVIHLAVEQTSWSR